MCFTSQKRNSMLEFASHLWKFRSRGLGGIWALQ